MDKQPTPADTDVRLFDIKQELAYSISYLREVLAELPSLAHVKPNELRLLYACAVDALDAAIDVRDALARTKEDL